MTPQHRITQPQHPNAAVHAAEAVVAVPHAAVLLQPFLALSRSPVGIAYPRPSFVSTRNSNGNANGGGNGKVPPLSASSSAAEGDGDKKPFGLGSLWAAYNSLLATQPILTKSLTSMTGFALGDLLAQKFIEKKVVFWSCVPLTKQPVWYLLYSNVYVCCPRPPCLNQSDGAGAICVLLGTILVLSWIALAVVKHVYCMSCLRQLEPGTAFPAVCQHGVDVSTNFMFATCTSTGFRSAAVIAAQQYSTPPGSCLSVRS